MYCEHFGFSEDPFSASPDPRFFYQVEQHREALASLYYAMLQRRGFGLLIGRPGLGKTSVLGQLIQLLQGRAEVAFLPQPYFDHISLLEAILIALSIEPKGTAVENHLLFNQYLLKTRAVGKTCVLIFDEAQNFSLETLEAVRMLSNFEKSAQKLVQIVLAGQPRLAELLMQAASEQIRQRINVVSRLKRLASYEVYDYIAHRLQIVGSSSTVFAPAALRDIATGSGGVPRNVNTICFNALSLAYALDRPQVGCAEVAEAIRDLDLGSELVLASEDVHVPPAPFRPIEHLAGTPTREAFGVPDAPRKGRQLSGPMPFHTRFSQVVADLRRKWLSYE
jgi:general secretion pathway protein A